MRRLLFEIAYQGTRYHGYQVQANALTVAQVVQDAVEKVFGRREGITGCSRTDAGVHAGQYFFHMDTGSRIPVDAAVRAMNVNLPGDIAVLSCREVPPSFHARYSVLWKEYTYKIWNAPVRSPFYDGLMLMHPYPLDEALMDRLCKGVHRDPRLPRILQHRQQGRNRLYWTAGNRPSGRCLPRRSAGKGMWSSLPSAGTAFYTTWCGLWPGPFY